MYFLFQERVHSILYQKQYGSIHFITSCNCKDSKITIKHVSLKWLWTIKKEDITACNREASLMLGSHFINYWRQSKGFNFEVRLALEQKHINLTWGWNGSSILDTTNDSACCCQKRKKILNKQISYEWWYCRFLLSFWVLFPTNSHSSLL